MCLPFGVANEWEAISRLTEAAKVCLMSMTVVTSSYPLRAVGRCSGFLAAPYRWATVREEAGQNQNLQLAAVLPGRHRLPRLDRMIW